MKRKQLFQGILWMLIYIVLVLSPVFVLLVGDRPPGREFWRELSVSLGFVGLAMMTLQFVLTARFKWLQAPYGSDLVYHFHCHTAKVSFILIMIHPLLLFIFAPQTLRLLNILTAPWLGRVGVISLLALIGLVCCSIWRQRLKIEYTAWRIWHGLFAITAVSMATAHILLVGHYVNQPWKRTLWIGYSVFWVSLLIYIRFIKPLMLMRRPFKVVEVKPERGSAWNLTLEPAGNYGMKFIPGQFAWLTAWDTPFANSEHPFSIASSSEDTSRISFTIKELGDFTRRIGEMKIGQTVYLDGPFGSFSSDRHPLATGFVFIAGGIGVVPVMSMLRTMADRGDTRPLVLIYANNTWEDTTCREDVEELEKSLNLKVVYVVLSPPPDWQGETGFVTQEILQRYLPDMSEHNSHEIFICGPQPMMDAVEHSLTEMKIWFGDFHSERFDMV